MAATEKIGTTELSTFGLRLAHLDGNLDLPGFKEILREHDYQSNLQVLQEKKVRITLIGFYGTQAAAGTAIENFKTQIKSALKQTWTFTNHSFVKTCVVKEGMTIRPYAADVEIDLTLTIAE